MKETFILYTEYAKHLLLLSMEQRGVLFTAIMNYQTGEELPEMDDVTTMAFSFIRSDLERTEREYQKKIETNRENGKLGGRPRKDTENQKANGLEEKPKKANGFFQNPSDSDNDSDSECDSDKYKTELRACAREDTDETVEKYLKFQREHPSVEIDITNPSFIATVDFELLSQKIAESKFLQTRYSLSWLIRHYREIVSDSYKDFVRSRASPDEKPVGRFAKSTKAQLDSAFGEET